MVSDDPNNLARWQEWTIPTNFAAFYFKILRLKLVILARNTQCMKHEFRLFLSKSVSLHFFCCKCFFNFLSLQQRLQASRSYDCCHTASVISSDPFTKKQRVTDSPWLNFKHHHHSETGFNFSAFCSF